MQWLMSRRMRDLRGVGCSMSRSLRLWRKMQWLMSRRMRDVRRVGANAGMVDVAQNARRTWGIEFLFRNSKETV
ncbi:hypothetical protein CWE25_00490 [Idiomarina fontislapidosi]|uniref:Uncharacterized protein n=2 Tax=Idiomarina fontislapidosi TaxID=263723 RepID=A0A432YAU9_9GAMM|nr:hypothetical protein CWE25_00490 [Idiomarina fontislapidosi]